MSILLPLALLAAPLPDLPPIPVIPAPLPVDSVPLLDSASAPEVKLDLPIAPGPFEPTWASIEKNYPGTPAWLREAKFGIWVHFGPQAAGESGDWYARHVYKPDHLARRNFARTYGPPDEVGYKEVLRDWNPVKLDPAALAALYKEAGARFLFVQGVHHDNYDLWDSRYQPWNSTRLGPKRDFVGEWALACRANGLRFGVTFHHEYTWWWWQTAFMADREGPRAGIPYDGHLTLADGVGKWWEGLDPRLLYGIDLREYAGVSKAALSPWTPPPAGLFGRHADYANWYATWWALRMMDVVAKYDPDFIYTDGTGTQPFSGDHTGTGLKADAMQRVIADFYNRALTRRGQVDTFSIVKFRPATNGTVNTEEFGIPAAIKTDQPWIAEAPVGDWFYAPGFFYDSSIVIRYIIESAARDGAAAVCISPRPDGSLDEGTRTLLQGVGEWMRRNGDAIYGSKAWSIPGEGQIVKGKLKMLPGGKLGRAHAEITFGPQDFRFTVGKDGALYATCLTVPASGTELRINSLSSSAARLGHPVKSVTLLGHDGPSLVWRQTPEALVITCPDTTPFRTALVFRID
ncbi:alpha-L-fucosidase [Verrucomicrobia bacterium IMCC26134]|nr:alpha-L-fucosidase [Verrucomicrobia bacterium IMCC26134]